MALEKATISINLGNGVDQKTDSKVGPDNKFNYMQNWIYDKLGKLYKRFGTDKLTDTVVTTFPNPLTIGTSEIPSSTFSNSDQLLMQNKGALYSYYEDQDKWYFKGHYYPLEIKTQTSVAGDPQYFNPTAFYVAGLRIIVYTAFDPATSTLNTRYTVIEHSTGNYLVDDSIIGAVYYPRVLSFASRSYLTWQDSANIKIAEINLTNGTIGASSNLVTDAKLPLQTDVPGLAEYPYQFVVTNKAGVGERAIFVYYDTSNEIKLVAVQDNGTVDSGITAYTNAQTVQRGFGIQYNIPSDTLFITYQLSTLAVRYQSLSFNSSGFTAINTATVKTSTSNIQSFDLANSPVSTSQVYFLFDEFKSNAYMVNGYLKSFTEPVINTAVLTTNSIATASSEYITGFQLSARSVTDSFRNTIYSFIQNTAGDTQQTFFMIDLLKGKTENAPYVQGKWQYGTAQLRTSASLPQTSMIGNVIYVALGKLLDLFGNPVLVVPANPTAPQLASKIGICETFIDLTPEASATNTFLANATHTSGGYLGYYDGSTFNESSYFLMPELLDISRVNATTGANWATFQIVQQGDGTKPEIGDFYMPVGKQVQTGPGSFITFFTTASQVNVGFRVDGVGSIPIGPGTNILVDVLSTDTSNQVAQKVITAINASGVAAVASFNSSVPLNVVRITNNSNGAVTDGTITGLSIIPPFGLTAGTYRYKALWSYFDVHGQQIYSATSPDVSVTVALGEMVNIVAYAPLLTNRDVATVRIQWYRTKANDSTFYKISSVVQDNVWTLGRWRYTYTDNKTDVAIDNSPEIIYTNGGVLDNFQIPQIKHVSKFKNRIIASGSDDETGFYYSKTALPGVPAEFAAEFFIQLDNDSDPITGHAQLDDKLIIFKKHKIFYMAGDGANDLGQGSTFTVPLLIATDVGCLSHNTIVVCPLGLMFKSDKGIYLLDRSLSLSYIGKEVEEYNDQVISKALLIDDQNQIRFNLRDSNISLVYDYLFNRWAIFTQYGGTDATIWKTKYTRIDLTGRSYVENKTIWIDNDSAVESYTPTFETHWLQLKNVQDYQRIYRLAFLGDLKSPHNLNYKIYYDYDDTQYDSYTFSSSNITGTRLGDSVYQPIVHLRQQKCDAIKIVIEVEPLGGTEESLQLVDMSFIVGVKRGLMKVRARKML